VSIFWLDANVFIQAMHGPFGFDSVPQFWTFLAKHINDGNIKSPKMVCDEILKQKDDLARWVKPRRELSITANPQVHANFRQIASHVHTKYKPQKAAKFLSDGDPWVIAHAMEDNGITVTHETPKGDEWKIKIPVICKVFDVRCINTWEMNKELKFKIRE